MDVVEEYLEEIERWSELNSYARTFREESLASARRAAKDIRERRKVGPLHGVPVGLKDVFDVRGYPTTMACKAFRDNIAKKDSTVVARLKHAGAILIGKHNSSELAMGATGEESYFGPTKNPWNLRCVSGGTSSGSGAAVAAGLCAGAIGSDATGSVRIPAAFCGVVGLKPTFGRVSKLGEGIGGWSLSQPGVLTRRVPDAALMLQAIAGHDPRDPTSSIEAVADYLRGINRGVTGLRVGVSHDYFFEGLQDGVRRSVTQAVAKLKELGARVSEVGIPRARFARSAALIISASEHANVMEPYLRRRPDDFNPYVKARLELGRLIFASDYVRAQRIRSLIVKDLAKSMSRIDVLAMPTAPICATELGQTKVKIGRGTVTVRSVLARFTTIFSLAGFPSISVPCGFDSSGLPVGLQLVAKPFQESLLFRAANGYQSNTRWHERIPRL